MSTAPSTQILLFDGLDELDAVAPFEILAAAGFPVRTVALGAAPGGWVTGDHGLRMGVDAPLDEAAGGLLVVPGGSSRRVVRDGVVAPAIARCHAAGATIATVCTGGIFAAAGGLLTGRPAVTHHEALGWLGQLGADVRADARVVDDGDLITSGGVVSGLDLAVHLVERYLGPEAAEAAARRIEHERRHALIV